MNNKRNQMLLAILLVVVLLGSYQLLYKDTTPNQGLTEDHDDHGDENGENDHGAETEGEDNEIEMNADERRAQGLTSMSLNKRVLTREVLVPGEVTLDLYNSSLVTPRISAQVIARHSRMGEQVTAGQPIVTLSSVEMANAQGELIIANQEWQRVSQLGGDVVSGRRYLEAQVAAQQARATVEAFGMAPAQIAELLENGDVASATGSFTLGAPQDGTIVGENFVLGEFVEPGHVLFTISDESKAWVNARLRADQTAHMAVGTKARISVDNLHDFEGTVIQVHHSLNEVTRTLPVRIEVINGGDELHPGQFVEVAIIVEETLPVYGVPEEALTLLDGISNVFVIEEGHIRPRPVEVGETYNGWVEVRAGISGGEEIVTSHVFLLKSLLLKSRMGEGHGH